LTGYQQFESASAAEVLSWGIRSYGKTFAIATSFQKEGMVIIDLASRIDPQVRVFTLDTGRLPEETHFMMDKVREQYGLAVEVVHPDPAEVTAMVAGHGRDLFYESMENRRLCCEIRKVRPLERKLAGLRAWATGLRREQTEDRAATPRVQELDGRVKINPLADWTLAQVDQYIAEHAVPLHPLYARGFGSIGCAPCTRALEPGESERAGRWWWEHDDKKECGIHISAAGLVRRA
jgi:phosphoadenosine phosphosulfate reductase